MDSDAPKAKPDIVKSYFSTMETSVPPVTNGSSVGDLTARNHSRHEIENSESGSSTQSQWRQSNDQHVTHSDKQPYLPHLSMDDDGITPSSRISNGDGSNTHHQSNILSRTFFYLILGGAIMGMTLPKNTDLPSHTWQILSNIVGYTYFLAWSSSFYPQIFLNYRRGTTRGLSVDFCVLNVLGYICYTIYTANFYWNVNIIRAYKDRPSGGGVDGDNASERSVTVQGNDVAFAIHAVLMASVTLCQIGIYDTFIVRPPSRRVYFVLLATSTFCIFYLLSTRFLQGQVDFLGFLYVLGTIKIGVTIGKYVPQALLNRSRKSTVGWNVWNVILDLTGGVLSLLQLVGDCTSMRDWTGITGNPAKMALSLITICFDLIFLVQHYILYPENDDGQNYSPLPAIPSMEVK